MLDLQYLNDCFEAKSVIHLPALFSATSSAMLHTKIAQSKKPQQPQLKESETSFPNMVEPESDSNLVVNGIGDVPSGLKLKKKSIDLVRRIYQITHSLITIFLRLLSLLNSIHLCATSGTRGVFSSIELGTSPLN